MTDEEFEIAYRLGFAAGVEVGYGRRCAEEEAEWKALAEHVQKHARMRTLDEIQQARQEAA
ncbi:hypothetical protein ACIBP6_43140 [Nonomuraea terrae]|uniref:hypothetical protein n=1 Tax=Nonomuraea terrae TaxID=2530383 RepID=UPI00378D7966